MTLIGTYGGVLVYYEKEIENVFVILIWNVTEILVGSFPFPSWNSFLEKVL